MIEMTVEDHGTLRAVIVPAGLTPAESRAGKLLRDLGHDVSGAATADKALGLLREAHTDLMVVDICNSEENQSLLRRLMELPKESRPGTLAIFADSNNESPRERLRRITGARTHVLIK